jgi:hypothetical protein
MNNELGFSAESPCERLPPTRPFTGAVRYSRPGFAPDGTWFDVVCVLDWGYGSYNRQPLLKR